MRNDVNKKAAEYTAAHKKKKRLYKVVTCLASVVVFCTTYALILPAITLESKACTIPEHVHTDACYTHVTTETEKVLTCGIDPEAAHLHTADCYDENGDLICTKEEAPEHVHTDECYTTVEKTVDKMELTCGLEEHVHTDECKGAVSLTEEEQQRVDELIAMIDQLPTSDEAMDILETYDDAGNDAAYEEYYVEIRERTLRVYVNYQDMDPAMQVLITNSDKLMEFSWLWTMTYATDNKVDVVALNYYDGGTKPFMVYNSNGTTVKSKAPGMTFGWWVAIHVEYENGRYTVKEIGQNNGDSKADMSASGNGFVLLYYPSTTGSISANVGDTVIISSDFWKTNSSVYNNGTSLGSVTFSSPIAQKNAKDNTSQLHVVDAASTRDFIEINLYDYGSGSTGKNINYNYNADKNMPGFQQSGGTSNIPSLTSFRGTSYMNFGDIITADPNSVDGTLVTLASKNPVGINVVQDTANSPISRFSDVMYKTLKDGYPALANGTSLGYLFGEENTGDYSKKMNELSVDGLFRYDEDTGAYSFNSRTNFAQFNSSDDTFTLYDEIFTPNFIMYPFGNFMPFNDIVHDSKQVSQIDEDYFNELYMQANYLYQQGKGDSYAQLAKVLSQFMGYAKDDNWGDDWTAERALGHYFYWGSELPKDDDNNYNQISLDRLYSLDYDVPSDFFFGMEMKMNFFQPKNGLTGKDGQQPMKFYFTGDDDVWVYIDGILFLDLSGIHRHVGGEIDFENGEIKYYSLDTMKGDVSSTPYKTVKFSELVDSSLLNEKGAFKDYSNHSFNFYYMERGSGSSVCRMNFNFPLLKQNSISVTKELTVDEEGKTGILGNPDFRFQVLKEDGKDLFIQPGTEYTILNAAGEEVGKGTTDANGVFTIKADQTAVFEEIPENSGKYFVRELLETDAFSQFGTISVDGTTTTQDDNVTIGTDTFKGVDSTVKDMSSGSTIFRFDNKITFNKLGALEITKKLEPYGGSANDATFDFYVTLDGSPLASGTKYTVGGVEKTVTDTGIISLKADETAVISNIIAGSKFTVQERFADSAKDDYKVTYVGDDIIQNTDEKGPYVSGTIKTDAKVNITATNTENGVALGIPGIKTITNFNSSPKTFKFILEQVTDESGADKVADGKYQEATFTFGEDGKASGPFSFTLNYPAGELPRTLPAKMYFKIIESADDTNTVKYDDSVYVAEVTFSKRADGIKSEMTALWKDGSQVDISEEGIFFTNTLIDSLTISKTVLGSAQKGVFDFTVRLQNGGSPLSGDFKVIRTSDGESHEETITFDNTGAATIKLRHGESIKITGLPLGTVWTVTEEKSDDFSISRSVDSKDALEGNTASDSVKEGGSRVEFINTPLYQLPETGGWGPHIFIIGGLLLAAGAGALLIYNQQKRRKEEFFSS